MATKVKELLSQAHKGKDIGKKNGKNVGFKAVERNAMKDGISKEGAEKVAGKVFWNKINKMRSK